MTAAASQGSPLPAAVAGGDWLVPDWPAPPNVRACVTTRAGGLSPPPWGAAPDLGGGLNLGLNSGDAPARVQANREWLQLRLPSMPVWLRQVHGAGVVDADAPQAGRDAPVADAGVALAAGVVCAVLVADCLPVLFADRRGRAVAAAHAGWRGLAGGVLQATAARLRSRLGEPAAPLLAWLGPAIGPQRFEVGADVLQAMCARLPQADAAFAPIGADKYLADLYALARQALAQCGGVEVDGGGLCTLSDAARFYSYRRDGVTGRQAALVWRCG